MFDGGGVTAARARDIEDPLHGGERPVDSQAHALDDRRSPLPGFDPEFSDIVDYILRITYRIWEGNDPELVRPYYTDDCLIHTLSGPIVGAETVVANTAATLEAFPDRRLFADDVIWSEEGKAGFYTSHRITSPMTHRGQGHWGAPTGRRARVRTIADCLVRDNRIYGEWLMRDGLAMALQLGLDPWRLARHQAQQALDNEALQSWAADEITRLQREGDSSALEGLPPAGPHFRAGRRACRALERIWSAGDLQAAREIYSPVARLHGPSGRELFGHAEIVHHARSLLAGLVDVRYRIDHVAVTPAVTCAESEAVSVALRWTLTGRYAEHGLYGKPTGARLFLLGATHLDMIGDRIVEEWTVFDELAVLAQVAGALGAVS